MLGIFSNSAKKKLRLTQEQSKRIKYVISYNDALSEQVEALRDKQSYLTQGDYQQLGIDAAFDYLYEREAKNILKQIVLNGTGGKSVKSIDIGRKSAIKPLNAWELRKKDFVLKFLGVLSVFLFMLATTLVGGLVPMLISKSFVFLVILVPLIVLWVVLIIVLISYDLFSISLSRIIPIEDYGPIGKLSEIDQDTYDYIFDVYMQNRPLCQTDCERMRLTEKAAFLNTN